MSHGVLIVDDERHVLQSLQRLLRRDGYAIHLAESGREALEILSKTEIAAIVCDQRMPGMSGAEVLAEAYRLYPDSIRITLTGYTDLSSAQASINSGHVSQFLLKPWNDDHLRSVVADAVGAYRIVQDNRRLEALTRQQKEELEQWNVKLEEQVKERTNELRAQNENLKHLQSRIEQSLRDTVGLLAATLEAHSPNLGIHCKRVAQLARQLASQLELGDQEVRDIEFAAHLHDIGKIARPPDAEKSSRRRSDERREQSPHRHPEAGFAILSKVTGFESVAAAVQYQHEHFDGTGTPDGMNGDAIPLAARIIAVANAYDKAVHPSSDAAEFLPEKGKTTLTRGKGKHFDPHLVQLLIEYVEKVGAAAGGEAEVELSPKRLKEGMVLSRPLLNSNGTLLLKEATPLIAETIHRIRVMSEVNPLLAGVFVRCGAEDPIEQESTNTYTPPTSVASTAQSCSTQRSGVQIEKPDTSVTRAGSTTSVEQMQGSRATDGNGDMQRRALLESKPNRTHIAPGPVNTPARTRSKILVVDDSTLVCSALKRELRPENIETVVTDSGWTALNLIEQMHFDAVLIDLMMPAMSGEELIHRLHECAPTLRCIILTGNATKERVVALSREPNVVGILTKPWDHTRLISTIDTAIAKDEAEPVKGIL